MGNKFILLTGTSIFLLALFLDVLEFSFKRILWFMKTLRFWLYFVLHYLLSCVAAFLLREQISAWYLLALVATFLGVSVVSNTNVRIAGYNLIPIGNIFTEIRARMFEQAGDALAKAILIEQLQKLPLERIKEKHHAGLMGAGQSADAIRKKQEKAKAKARGDEEYEKSILIEDLVKAHPEFAEKMLDVDDNEGDSEKNAGSNTDSQN